MSSSSSSSSEEEHTRRRSPHGKHGRRYHRRHGRHSGGSQEREHWKHTKEGKGEVEIAVAIMCQDMKPYHQSVIVHLVKNALKGKGPKEEEQKERYRYHRRGKKKHFSSEQVKEIINEILKDKDKIVESIELILEVLSSERKKMYPKTEETKKCEGMKKEGEMFEHGHKRFTKGIAELITEMRNQGVVDKEKQKEMAKRFFEKMRKRHKKSMTKGARKMTRKILYYELENFDELYKRVVEGVVSDAFAAHCFMKMARKHEKMREEMKEFKGETEKPEEGKTEESERGEGRRGRGRGRGRGYWHHRGEHRGGWGHWGHFGHFGRRGHHMGERGKGMMHMVFKDFMLKKGLEFIISYYKKNADDIKTCFEAIKECVDNHFKNSKIPEEHKMKVKAKVMSEIVSGALRAAGEKKSKEFYVDYAKRYIKGCVTLCHKECVKKCQKMAKLILLNNGIKDECVIGVASRWGAIGCCQANGKDGCPEAACTKFMNDWITKHLPIVTEAVSVANETGKELMMVPAEEGKLIGILTLRYLTMECSDGKFNKEDFKKFLKEHKERMEKEFEAIKKECKGRYRYK